jgi:hypothetical protein
MSGLYFFYSLNSDFSKQCLELIQNNNLINNFKLCNVDNPKLKIPKFIQYVPTIFDASNKKMYINEELHQFLNFIINQYNGQQKQNRQQNRQPQQQNRQPQQQNRQPQHQNRQQNIQLQQQNIQQNNFIDMKDVTGDSNILGFNATELSGTGGGSYAFLNEDDNDKLPSTFEFLDRDNENLSVPKYTKQDGTNSVYQNLNGQGNVQGNSNNKVGVNRMSAKDQRKAEIDAKFQAMQQNFSSIQNQGQQQPEVPDWLKPQEF